MCDTKVKNRCMSIVLIFLIIFLFINVSFADDNAINEANETTYSNRVLSLQEQENIVKENLDKAREKLEYVEGALSTSLLEIQNLEERIAEYQEKLDKVNAEYQDIQNKVNETQKELDEIQGQYDRKNDLLKKRLVTLYKSGSTTYLDVLLNSSDIIDFISRYYIIKTIVEYDSKELTKLSEQKKKIVKTSNELKEQKANMKLIKAEAEEQTVVLTNTKTIVENQKLSLTESEQRLKLEIDAYLKQQEELENLIQNAIWSSTYELSYSGGIMMWPTYESSYITSPYGDRLHPIDGIIKNHDGIDIGGRMGDPVYAAEDGIIIYSAFNTGGYGNMVMIDHGLNQDGVKVVTLYGHGSKLLKSVGDAVKKGDIIMEVGSTGHSTGPHVHFEVRENGVSVNPKKYLSNEE